MDGSQDEDNNSAGRGGSGGSSDVEDDDNDSDFIDEDEPSPVKEVSKKEVLSKGEMKFQQRLSESLSI